MKNSSKLFVLMAIITSIVAGCNKDDNKPENLTLGHIIYSNLRWEGGNNHYWSVYTINNDGTEDRKLLNTDIGLAASDLSPDGSKILVDATLTPTSSRMLYIMNADGSNLHQLIQAIDVTSARWSSDGKKITFTKCYLDQNYRFEIWTMNSDGSNQKSIADGYGSCFSPDGTKLFYTSKKSGNLEIYSCNVDGTNQLKLTNSVGDEYNVDISPDGTKIVYSFQSNTDDSNSLEIYVMNTDGTNVTRLTNNNFLDEQARWSPDGALIAYISRRSATFGPEVYIMNVDGSNSTKVTNANGRSNSANVPIWNPKSLRTL